ncbi:hypothetical protein HPB50_007299 [Hyalomma asiaticum]|uniref:Uncharacterized protein n=1 Tax=Hyalomma asiaticum TaxID=266040 RepID=A0ACB7RJS7_HYAAI|nr:hypothetical protein HPB50_007299 [Hyalomma asiaticum]
MENARKRSFQPRFTRRGLLSHARQAGLQAQEQDQQRDIADGLDCLRNFTVVLQLIRALFEYVGYAGLVFWLMPQQMPRAIL